MVCALLACALIRADAADDADAVVRASLERIHALRKDRPGDGLLVFYQALTHINLGERGAAFALLRSLKGRKLGLIPVPGIGFDAVWNDPAFEAIRKQLVDGEPRTPASPVAFRLKDQKLIPEGIAYDAKGERFFIGSIAQRKIIVTDAKGEARDFSGVSDNLDAVLGLVVDAARGHLYAVSTNGFLDEAKTERRNAVVRYDLKDGRLLDRFGLPEAMQLNDLAVAPDGTLYITDSMSGILFRKKADDAALSRFGEVGRTSQRKWHCGRCQGNIVRDFVDRDRARRYGHGRAYEIAAAGHGDDGGIDGLYWHAGDLFGVQNGTNPGRVVRIALTDKGNRIAGLTVLQSHHHSDFEEPTTGTIANGALYVIGNSYVGRYQPDGTIKTAGDLKVRPSLPCRCGADGEGQSSEVSSDD